MLRWGCGGGPRFVVDDRQERLRQQVSLPNRTDLLEDGLCAGLEVVVNSLLGRHERRVPVPEGGRLRFVE